MIYKMNDIYRIAGEKMTEEFKATPYMHFTNTSYGEVGKVLCSIEGFDTNGNEHVSNYCLVKNSFLEKCIRLVCIHNETKWGKVDEHGNVIKETSRTRTTETILELWLLSDTYYSSENAVFTDDEEMAKQAGHIRQERHICKLISADTHATPYEKVVTDPVRKAELIKFIQMRYARRVLDKSPIVVYRTACRYGKPVLGIRYTYRNKEYTCAKC